MTQRLLDLTVKIFADGVDPQDITERSRQPYIHGLMRTLPNAGLLWASVREVLNVFQAAVCDCRIVTVLHDVLKKLLDLGGKDLDHLSLDTVRTIHRGPVAAGFKL